MNTDHQLKLALARMLPEKLRLWQSDQKFHWILEHSQPEILDTEWLHVCWLVNKTLTDAERCAYNAALMEINPGERFALNHGFNASWQQRAEALCKVKGIEV